MATYTIRAPDGLTVKVKGDKPPAAADLDRIFAAARQQQSPRQEYAGGQVQEGDYMPLRRPPPDNVSLPGRIIGGMVQPPVKMVTHGAQAANLAFQRLGLPGAPPNDPMYGKQVRIPLPDKLGGEIAIDAPTSGKQAARQLVGEGIQTSLLGIPGAALARAGLVKGGAAVGGAFGLGTAIEDAESVGEGAADVGLGALGGAVVGKGLKVAANALSKAPRSIPEAKARIKEIPSKLSDYFLPKAKAASVSEDIQARVSDVQRQFQTLREESGKLGDTKKALQIERSGKAALGKTDAQALETKWAGDIAKAESDLTAAIEKEAPVLKQQVLKVHSNMTRKYGEILDEAVEGHSFTRDEYQNKVVKPLLEMMDADAVPKDTRIYKTIEGLVKTEDEAVAATPLTANEFRHLRKQVMDIVGSPVKSGAAPAGMHDHWANEFLSLQGKFVAEKAPKLAAANKAYAEMAFARKWFYQKTRPLAQHDLDGATRVLRNIASGKDLSPTTRAVIKLAEEGKGDFAGVGRGEIGKGIRGASKTVVDRKAAYQAVNEQLKSRLAIEKDTLTKQIQAIEVRLRKIQSERADVTKQNQAIRELREKRTRLLKISRWERGLALMLAGYGFTQNKKVAETISKVIAAP